MLMQNFQKFKGINMNQSCIKNDKNKRMLYIDIIVQIIYIVIKINIR